MDGKPDSPQTLSKCYLNAHRSELLRGKMVFKAWLRPSSPLNPGQTGRAYTGKEHNCKSRGKLTQKQWITRVFKFISNGRMGRQVLSEAQSRKQQELGRRVKLPLCVCVCGCVGLAKLLNSVQNNCSFCSVAFGFKTFQTYHMQMKPMQKLN